MPTPWKQMLCEEIYKGHIINKGDIHQIGYDTHELTWLYAVICARCNKTSLVTRRLLDDMLFKDNHDRSNESDQSI